MISTAADLRGGLPCGFDMTVFELALFMSIYRMQHPVRLADLAAAVSDWFDVGISPEAVGAAVTRMIERGWLLPIQGRIGVSAEGRDAARPLVESMIRMLDQGTRLLDVALMMSVLRLTKGELDDRHDL